MISPEPHPITTSDLLRDADSMVLLAIRFSTKNKMALSYKQSLFNRAFKALFLPSTWFVDSGTRGLSSSGEPSRSNTRNASKIIVRGPFSQYQCRNASSLGKLSTMYSQSMKNASNVAAWINCMRFDRASILRSAGTRAGRSVTRCTFL